MSSLPRNGEAKIIYGCVLNHRAKEYCYWRPNTDQNVQVLHPVFLRSAFCCECLWIGRWNKPLLWLSGTKQSFHWKSIVAECTRTDTNFHAKRVPNGLSLAVLLFKAPNWFCMWTDFFMSFTNSHSFLPFSEHSFLSFRPLCHQAPFLRSSTLRQMCVNVILCHCWELTVGLPTSFASPYIVAQHFQCVYIPGV